MKKLQKSFTKGGLTYTHCNRVGCVVLYSVSKNGKIRGYEVAKISSHNGYVIGGRKIDASECYPGNEQCGKTLWYFGPEDENETALEMAKKKFRKII